MKTGPNPVFEECASVVRHDALPAQQFVLRLHAPECARHATAGNFLHLQCDPQRAMRRPFSIMRCDPAAGDIEILYKIVGLGSAELATRKPGDTLQCLGPIGNAFSLHENATRPLLLGGGVGIPPIIFLAEKLRENSGLHPIVILGSEIPFPFPAKPSKILAPDMPKDVIAAMPLLDDWGIVSRLTSLQGYPGCFQGYVHQLAEHWFLNLDQAARQDVQVFACGPNRMLEAVSGFCREHALPCQVCLEEFMACAVGGCAGCVVPYRENNRTVAMKRVCVDGPVFDAANIF
ncbi:MAG: dihydroorotate dehydrogenase electron transfer subunit [Gammaproteobacteria bacterium]|nr:dihydroorotate dehydrogenase electron transfer subunit [Gammaproteobacteria bacterium]